MDGPRAREIAWAACCSDEESTASSLMLPSEKLKRERERERCVCSLGAVL